MFRVIFTYGFHRTGTTWTFNVIREILKRNKISYKSFEYKSFDYNYLNELIENHIGDYFLIIKTHSLDSILNCQKILEEKKLSFKVLFNLRDPRDVICSRIR